MSDYDNTNSGALFKNDKKATEKHPDYKGSVNADGTDYWLSAWLKTDKNGNKYMSLGLTPKNEDASPSRPKKEAPTPADDLPF